MDEQKVITEPRLFLHSEASPHSTHDAIVQTLDRNVGGVPLSTSMFESSLKDWDGIPLVFAQDHPDMELYERDPEAALEAVKGRHVGTFSDPAIKKEGHPRLWGKFNFTDPEMKELSDEGKLSLSTAFWALKQNGEYVGTRPQNILVFQETERDLPRDLGTGILNKDSHNSNQLNQLNGENMPDETNDKLVSTQLVAVQNKYEAAVQELETTKKELKSEQVKNKTLEDENAAKDEKIKALEEENQTFKQKEIDGKWVALKNKLPKGLVHDEAATKASREEWEKDPQAFMFKVVDAMSKQPDGTEEEGQQFRQHGRTEDDVQVDKDLEEMGINLI
jgi:hypothetical protein